MEPNASGVGLGFPFCVTGRPRPQTADAAFEGLGGVQSVKVPLWMTALTQLCAFWEWEEADCVLLQRLAVVCVELTRRL